MFCCYWKRSELNVNMTNISYFLKGMLSVTQSLSEDGSFYHGSSFPIATRFSEISLWRHIWKHFPSRYSGAPIFGLLQSSGKKSQCRDGWWGNLASGILNESLVTLGMSEKDARWITFCADSADHDFRCLVGFLNVRTFPAGALALT